MSVNDSSSPSSDRANLIRTAVVFLRSPRVISASEEKRRLFLKSKSMTDDEIATALALAADPVYEAAIQDETGGDASLQQQQQHDASLIRSRSTAQGSAAVSLWGSGGGRLLMLVIFGGLSYAVYGLYVRFVAPFLRRQKERDEKLTLLEESVQALQDNVALTVMKMQASVENLEASLQSRDSSMVQMESRLNHNQSKLIAEVKQEVASLKGVMLNVKNFPTPNLPALDSASTSCQQQSTSSASVVVSGGNAYPPAWQLQSSSNAEPAVSESEAALNVPVEVERRQPVVSSSSPCAAPVPQYAAPPPPCAAPVPQYAAPPPPYVAPLPLPAVEEDAEIHYEQIRPPSIPSRSTSSSGSSATSFEVIERKEYANTFVDNHQNTTLLVESDESEESVDGDCANGTVGGGEMGRASGGGGGGGRGVEFEMEGCVDMGVGAVEGNTIREEEVDNEEDDSETQNCNSGTSVLEYNSCSDEGCAKNDADLMEEEVTISVPEQETSYGDMTSGVVEEVN